MAENGTPSSPSSSTMRIDSYPSNQFKLVSRKRQRRTPNYTPSSIHSLVIALCGTLAEGEWFPTCSDRLKEAWGRSPATAETISNQVRVLCLGLGSPSTSQNARIQLAFLLEACKNLDIVCRECDIDL